MITNFYTLQALAKEWNQDLNGYILGDAYSQSKDEITLAFASKDVTFMVRVRIRQPFQYVFRVEGYNKARRNVATLFQEALDQRISNIRVADRDRMDEALAEHQHEQRRDQDHCELGIHEPPSSLPAYREP